VNTNPRISDDQLRALVRAAVARHLGQGSPGGHDDEAGGVTVTVNVFTHPSHSRYALPAGSPDEEGDDHGSREQACLIEPAVRCNHCGYCQSHGH
jgi:hypothetical protein